MFRKSLFIAGLQLRLIIRDKSSFIWLLLVPIVFTTIVGAAFGGFGSSGPAPRVPVAFVDLDQSAASSVFEQALRAESSLDVQMPSERVGRQELEGRQGPRAHRDPCRVWLCRGSRRTSDSRNGPVGGAVVRLLP